STRRLESALRSLKVGKPKKRLLRHLPHIRKACGRIRDMDVLAELAMCVRPNQDDKECLVQLLHYLGAKRSRHAKKLQRVAKKERPRVRRELTLLTSKLAKLAAAKGKPSFVNDAPKSSTLVQLASELKRPQRLNQANLHEYRKKVKDLRYTLQLSEEAQNAQIVEMLGTAKDAIGEWHDWQQLVKIASDLLDQGPEAGLVHQLKKVSDQKFQQALAITITLRATYLNVKQSHGKSRDRSIPFPVSVAQSAMQAEGV
ncbi:MAG: CHAD domain-containing protein, partial [Candidatus Acidiferrum sp.]